MKSKVVCFFVVAIAAVNFVSFAGADSGSSDQTQTDKVLKADQAAEKSAERRHNLDEAGAIGFHVLGGIGRVLIFTTRVAADVVAGSAKVVVKVGSKIAADDRANKLSQQAKVDESSVNDAKAKLLNDQATDHQNLFAASETESAGTAASP